MMTITTNHEMLLHQIEEMFPQGLPESLNDKLQTWKHSERVYGEMLTQVPTPVAQTMTALRDLQSAEMRVMLAALTAKGS